MRSIRILNAILVLGLAASPAAASTPPAACAADSLYLISPDVVRTDLQETGRLGMVISWPNLDLDEATCYTLKNTGGLGFVPTVTGGFGDRVDRVIGFSSADTGRVGAAQAAPLSVRWRSVGAATYGNLDGVINLANNGGIWRWNAATGTWGQANAGLPMSWRQANVVALAQGTGGVMYAGFTSGQTVDTAPQGLYRYDGAAWSQVGAAIFGSTRRVTAVAVDPTNNDRVAVGTSQQGLYVSSDGGQTFTNWAANLDPAFASPPANFAVAALAWGGGRLFAAINSFGVFVSSDGGGSFLRVPLWVKQNLDAAVSPDVVPQVNAFTIDPADPDRILAALFFHGVFESLDGGASWRDRYGDLVVPIPGTSGAWIRTAQSVAIDPGDPQVLVMGVLQRGLYRTADGGQTWQLVGQDQQPANTGQLTRIMVTAVPGQPARFLALEDKWNLLESLDGGLSWQEFAQPPALKTALSIDAVPGGSGDLLVGTWAGGTYITGTPVPLAQTYTTGTSPELRNLDLGLLVAFDAGSVAAGDAFELVSQTFQGWAVWRAPAADPDRMVMIGLYDRVNPEDCIEGYCGDLTYEPIPQCFAAKRAACFTGIDADTIRFFDDEIYNGFSYYYAVSSFDYGNTAATTPENNNKAMVISPRWEGDARSPFTGPGNRTFVRVDLKAEPAAQGEEIYVYPNPLRLDSGIPGEDGVTVVFTNLPPNSRIRVFTTAGDDVVDLGPDNQVGGQIRWLTRNRAQEPVSAGVYLYKVESPAREPYWGRLVVIR
ncbi:MAG: hypothetical protein IH621_09975 [Krumholzibacteria bacterium]|nr:hypothetical protein [Candidatus Krumholzibacteria bacterium]